MFKEQFYI
uniref:Uncharacterized protein n=1 Tax=Arundo donax TaxID=35708 RepID=A0A0A9ARR7_ARUDO